MSKFLLIAGGGTLGEHTAEELLRAGHSVDVVCLEDKASDNPRLTYYKANATPEFLRGLFAENRYDGIINFIHYPDWRLYPPYHELLIRNTERLVFLSSYRVYADLRHPVTEDAPQLVDTVTDDPAFFERENYARPKSLCERYLRGCGLPRNWIIARPVISFSRYRFDMILHSGRVLPDAVRKGETVVLPEAARRLTAGLDWSGNSGKLLAHLLMMPGGAGEDYTVSSGQNLTWEQVAECYTERMGVKFRWEDVTYPDDLWQWKYDRAYDRCVDVSKILGATGLGAGDFTPIAEGISTEMRRAGL